MGHRVPSHLSRSLITLGILVVLVWGPPRNPEAVFGQIPVSLKEYGTKAVPVPNPMDLTQLPLGQVYQVNHEHFIIQFFFSGSNIMAIVLKRNPKFPIHVRWCFFRSCEETPYDYKTVAAHPHQPPFSEDFFQARLPVRFKYQFQGLHFSSGMPNKPPP